MTEIRLNATLPLDSDGFLRRECPNCERQFKWLPGPNTQEDEEECREASESYFCPYCYEEAATHAWWTKEQLEYTRALVLTESVVPRLRRFQRDVRKLSQPGGLIQLDVRLPSLERRDQMVETDDMVRIDFPCHPAEPVKIDETWESDVACLVCGIRYPIDLLRDLPQSGGGR